jgi:hypothetical protein
MKKYNLFFLVLVVTCLLFSCGGKDSKTQGSNAGTDVIGEADSISPHSGRASESIAKATINGRQVEFKFMDNAVTNENTFNLTESTDGKYTQFVFELGSDDKMREKLGLMIINHTIGKATLPLVIPQGKQEGKQAKLELGIQKSSVFINYNNVDAFTCSITAASDSEIEGNFFGEVKNPAGRAIKVEDGYFKIKIKKVEMKVQ